MNEKTMQTGRADESRLIQQAQQGNPEAFAELFNRWNQPLLRYLYHTLGNGQEAEDLAQDAFLRAYQRLEQLGPPWDFKSWLYRIATNLAMDHLERERRYISVDSSDEAVEMELPGSTQPVERQVERLEQQRQVWKALRTLPTLYRQALVLRELNGLSYEEIHIALDCSAENARQLVHRARLRFRDEYGFTLAVTAGVPRCHVLGDLLSAYHDGQLNSQERQSVEQHLATCEDCRATQEEMKKVGALLLSLPPFLPSHGWMEKVRRRLRTEAAHEPAGRPEGNGRGGSGALWGLGFAGLVLILPVLAALLLWGRFPLEMGPRQATPPGREATSASLTQEFNQLSARRTSTLEASPTPSPTITPSDTPTPSVTPTPGPVMFLLDKNANCRKGPGTVYETYTSFLEGQSLQVDGRNDDLPRWWWALIPNSSQHCWLSSIAGTLDGDPDRLPIIPAPPTPTITPKPGGGIDFDKDGYPFGQDCNDKNAKIHPGALETPGDGIDSNCNGKDNS